MSVSDYAKYFTYGKPIKFLQANEIGVIISTYVTLVGFKLKEEVSTNVIFGEN